jgi:hypothetical protein
MQKTKFAIIATSALAALVGVTACTGMQQSSTAQGQQTTEDYAKKFTTAEPYPLAQVNDSSERANLREKLLRMNDPHKIGYLYELTQTGQVIAQYTVKGKVTSTQSQLTNTQLTQTTGSSGITTVDSMGDDGSYGPNEGGQNGIFFFTTSGVMVEYNGLWQYSDAPLNLTSKPLIVVDDTQKPSSNAGQLK